MEQDNRVEKLVSEKTSFKREIGVFGGVSIIGGIMIGSGIFYLGSYVLQRTGMNSGLALLCWVIGGVISLCGGLCFAELGAAMPKAGGKMVYLNEAYHPVVGFMCGFTDWLVGGPGSNAALGIALMAVFKSFLNISDFGVKVGAAVLIVGLTIYNLYGVKLASVIQNVSMVAKLIPIGIIMLAALFAGKITPDLSLGSSAAYASANHTSVFSMIALGVVAALWAYDGWNNINTVTEEIKNPRRDLPLALIIGIGGITVLYTLFNFAIMRALPHAEIVKLINKGDLYLGTTVATRLFGTAGATIVSVGMILAMFGCLNGLIMAQPRLYYEMAVDGHFFKSFAKLHPKYRVPTAAILVQGVLSVILIFLRNLDQLTNLVVITGMIFNVMDILAVPILRKKYPNIERPYKVWLYPVTVIISAVVLAGLVVLGAMDDPVNGAIGLLVPALGALVYYLFDRNLKKNPGRV